MIHQYYYFMMICCMKRQQNRYILVMVKYVINHNASFRIYTMVHRLFFLFFFCVHKHFSRKKAAKLVTSTRYGNKSQACRSNVMYDNRA